MFRYFLVAVGLLVLVGCNETGACMMKVEGAAVAGTEVCTEVKKSTCAEGHDRWVGGKCPAEKKTGK